MTRMRRSGSFAVEEPYGAVFGLLSDAEAVARCLPDTVESVNPSGEGVDATVVTGVPNVQTRLRVRLRRTAADEDAGRVAYEGHGSSARSRVDFSGEFEIDRIDGDGGGGTRVGWQGEAHVRGMLASLGDNVGRFDGIVERKIETAVGNVRTAVNSR